MKLKYYMRGLGIGIILTTIILSISFHSSSNIQLSDEEIIKRAEELGMISNEKENPDEILKTSSEAADNNETMDTIEDNKQEDAQTSEPTEDQTKEEMEAETIEEISDETKEISEGTGNSDTREQPEQVDESTQQDLTVAIEIKEGMTSEDVASLFKNYGVVKDYKHFNQYMVENGYSKIINYGLFELPLDASYEQIADVIIR